MAVCNDSRSYRRWHGRFADRTYLGACVVAGAFTLLPQRFLGQLVWHHWLGWI